MVIFRGFIIINLFDIYCNYIGFNEFIWYVYIIRVFKYILL